MSFLNLSLAEFLTLFVSISGLITALYFLDRVKKRRTVSTLRFFAPNTRAEQKRSSRRVREPWSLLLQLLSLALLLLALSRLQWGAGNQRIRNHVVILDTSSWMAQRNGSGALQDEAIRVAQQYVRRLPVNDRVLLVRADGLSTPVTRFTSDHEEIVRQIRQTKPSYSALNLAQAVSFAKQAQSWPGGMPGEIAYVGSNRLDHPENLSQLPENFRVLLVSANQEHLGIQHVEVHRSEQPGHTWDASVTVRNYGSVSKSPIINASFGRVHFAPKSMVLEPGEERSATFSFSTGNTGRLESLVAPADSLSLDQRTFVELPNPSALRVAVFTSRASLFRPLLDSDRRVAAKYFDNVPGASPTDADLVIYDRMAPPTKPDLPALYIMPPTAASPLPVSKSDESAIINQWNDVAGLGEGLRSKELRVSPAMSYKTDQQSVAVANASNSAIVVAHLPVAGSKNPFVLVGFDPLGKDLRYQLTTPLLFANMMRWLSPDKFRVASYISQPAGVASMQLDRTELNDEIRVVDSKNRKLPHIVQGQQLQFFVTSPTVATVTSLGHERTFFLTLPEIAQAGWTPAEKIPRGLPAASIANVQSTDLWRWLAVAAALTLLTEWLLFGRGGSSRVRRSLGANDLRPAEPVDPAQKKEEALTR